MRVSFKLGEPLATRVGQRLVTLETELSAATVGDALAALAERYPDVGQELRLGSRDSDFYYSLFLNDRLVPFANRDRAALKDGDVISILLPLAGGRD
jgi:molybdopterin converting factor small subunit